MKHLLLAPLITLLAIGTACGQAPEPEPVASDGIQVHGHWTVTVTNPDGTVDAVHEFENEISAIGRPVITALLIGDTDVAEWNIDIRQQLPVVLGCVGVETFMTGATVLPGSAYRDTGALNAPIKVSAACTVSGLASEDEGKIIEVGIRLKLTSEIKYLSLTDITTPLLTNHTLDPKIEVSENQSVSFNVSLSFS